MLHLIVGLIGAIFCFAIFGEFILVIALLIGAVLLASLVGWLIGLYTVEFTIIGLGVILLAAVLLLFDKVKSFIPKKHRSAAVKKEKELKVKAIALGNPEFKKYFPSGSTDEFRSKYPFVVFEVPVESRETFIRECLWLHQKTGLFPSEQDQKAILYSIQKDHGTELKSSTRLD